MDRLKGKVALVTGGGRGIGRSIALAMAREGAMIAVSSRTTAELDKVAAEARAAGAPDTLVIQADATKAADQRGAVKAVVEKFGRIDILVNNAGGVTTRTPQGLGAYTHDDDTFADNIDLNLNSAYWATAEALPHMRQHGYGRVMTIGSGYAKRSGGPIAYTVAKHGLIGLTRALAHDTAAHGITVNCLCPGWTNTQLVNFEAQTPAFKAMVESENLQHRIVEPDELGPMAVLLASPESAAITGQVISVDGGYKV
ncbi:SDR family NAD(P)-dependent oxidoreductase [uncultured Phenylobacterium sp.]|uniref:SDR family NAD(P)-dependent oxidoreductase n=1 Tax=uncultured Phenylobacterium sp. TaxID=349273 RepID=UPI0025F56AF0|nr:SDR family oxidoreductase [uncultured Phenylobacterium sp.]